MNSAHPEVGVPSPELDQRNPGGWILLLGMVALMVVTQLVSYFDRTPTTTVLVTRTEQQLKVLVSAATIGGGREDTDAILTLAGNLEPKLSDAKVAALYAAAMTEAGQKFDRKKIASLRAGKDESNHAIFDIYSDVDLTKEEANRYVAKLSTKGFLNQLIRVHAFEKAKVQDSGRDELTGKTSIVRLVIAGLFLGLVFLLGLAVLIGFFIARNMNLLKPLGFPTGEISLADADRLVMRSAQIFVAFLGVGLIGGILLRPLKDSPFASLPLYLAIVFTVFLLARVPVWGKWISLKSIGISKENLGRHALWGVGAALANGPILILVLLLSSSAFKGLPPPEHPTTVELTTTSNPWVILVSIVMAAVMAPIIEEIMFRGTMFPGFSRAFRSPLWGGVATSLIFAAIHPTGIPAWPALAAIGGMSCVLVYQTRSLVPSMIMHATHNFGTLLLVLLTTR